MADESEEALDAGRWQALENRRTEVDRLLRSGDAREALHASLDNPPFNTKDKRIKAENAEVVMRAVAAVKDSEVPAVVDSLSEEQCDILMKYVYRGMEEGDNQSQLLKWHSRIHAKAGVASIVRVMTARKAV